MFTSAMKTHFDSFDRDVLVKLKEEVICESNALLKNKFVVQFSRSNKNVHGFKMLLWNKNHFVLKLSEELKGK
jgi:hypothetical protein